MACHHSTVRRKINEKKIAVIRLDGIIRIDFDRLKLKLENENNHKKRR